MRTNVETSIIHQQKLINLRASINFNLSKGKFSNVGQARQAIFDFPSPSSEKPILIRHKTKRSPNGTAKLQKGPAIAIPPAAYCIVIATRGQSTRTPSSFPRPSLGDQRHRCGIPRSRRSSNFSIVTGWIHDPGCLGPPSSLQPVCCLPRIPLFSFPSTFYVAIDGRSLPFLSDDENRFTPATRQRAAPHSYLGR